MRIRGVIVPVVTPFKADLSPDRQRFIRHCQWLFSQDCGLAVFGTTSEANSMSTEDRKTLLDALVGACIETARTIGSTPRLSWTRLPQMRAACLSAGDDSCWRSWARAVQARFAQRPT